MTYNFPDHIKGNTFKGIVFTIKVNGVVSDLTGCEIKMHIKTSIRDVSPVAEYSTTNLKIELTDPTNGKFAFKEQIIDVAAALYVYDIEITYPDDTVFTYIRGTWKINQNITHG